MKNQVCCNVLNTEVAMYTNYGE